MTVFEDSDISSLKIALGKIAESYSIDERIKFLLEALDAINRGKKIATPPASTVSEPMYADPFTYVIQHLNSSPYNLTKSECITRIKELRDSYTVKPPADTQESLTKEQYTALAHRIASKYAHRSDPQYIAYTFLPHTLEQFVRAIEAAIGKQPAEAKPLITREQHFALREAFAIGAADSYFEAYPTHDNDVGRMLFERGFARGFDSHERAIETATASSTST